MSRVDYPEWMSPRAVSSGARSLISEMAEAFSFLRKHALLLVSSVLFAWVNFCLMPFNVLRTPYVMEILQAGAWGLSLLSGLLVGGIVLGGLWMSQQGTRYRKSVLVIIGIVMLGCGYAMTALPAYMTSFQLPTAVCSVCLWV